MYGAISHTQEEMTEPPVRFLMRTSRAPSKLVLPTVLLWPVVQHRISYLSLVPIRDDPSEKR
jgi:hypothetical protein